MSDGGEQLPQVGDAARQEAAEAIAFLDHLKASRPAKITNAERDADKAEIAKLRADLAMTQRAVVRQGERIRELNSELQAVRSAVINLQKTRLRTGQRIAPQKKRDGLDDELERDLYR
jgi:hypothetical protein